MKRLISAILVTLAFASSAVLAEETLLDYVLEACDDDLKEFCDQVTPGEGRLAFCITAHEDKISSECAYALYDAATVLQELVRSIVYLAESCATEIDAYCGETPMGEGRILACLEERGEELSEMCRMAIDDVVVE